MANCDVNVMCREQIEGTPDTYGVTTMPTTPDPLVSEVTRLAKDSTPGKIDEAYQTLQQGYQDFLDQQKACTGGNVDNAKAEQYWQDVTQELSRQGVIPDLSVAWANANFDKLDIMGRKTGDPKGPDGMLTIDEIRRASEHDQVFARQFEQSAGKRNFFFRVADLSDNGNTRKVIEQEDIDKYMRKADKRLHKIEKQDDALDAMGPLFEPVGCDKKPLIEYINGMHKVNGRITVKEMERFINECNTRPQDDVYNEKHAQYVQDILDGKYPQFERSGDGFNINKLGRKGGFSPGGINAPDDHVTVKENFDLRNKPIETKEINRPDACKEKEEQEKKEHTEKTEKTEKLGCVEVPDSIFKVRQGEGYWHVAKRLLSQNPQDKPTNQEIMHCMTVLMTQNSAALNKEQLHGYAPLLHTGNVVHCDINALCAQVPAAKRILRR